MVRLGPKASAARTQARNEGALIYATSGSSAEPQLGGLAALGVAMSPPALSGDMSNLEPKAGSSKQKRRPEGRLSRVTVAYSGLSMEASGITRNCLWLVC